jgi:HEAT repeat protein
MTKAGTACGRRLLGVLALCAGLASGCEKDPNDPQTWVDKLGDRTAQNEALHRLERMADPASLKPLAEAWKKQNKPSTILRTMISIAGTIAAKDPKAAKAAWADTLPVLTDAVDNFDQASSRSIDDAVVSCAALGRAADPAAEQTVINAAQKPLPKLNAANHVRIACARALGKFHDPKVADVLIRILETDPERQVIHLNAAAALALAESGDPKALPALINAMYFMPPIFQQVRQAVTRVGKPAIPVLLNLLQEKDADIAAKAKDKGFDKKAPGNIPYKAALLLGDMRAKEAVPYLLAVLKTEPRVAFIDERSGQPGPTTHEGALGALRLIMDPSTAAPVKAYWMDPKGKDFIKPTAIDVYSMLASDESALPDLLKMVQDEKANQATRLAAIIAYGRLAHSKDEAKPLADVQAGYEDKLHRAEEKAKAAKTPEEKATVEDERQLAAYWRDALNESQQRIGIAAECGPDAVCYTKALPPTVKEFKVGTANLPRAERALLEIGKLGENGRAQTDALLAAADTTERFVRQGLLLALPRIAPLPCQKCADRLDEVIEKQADTTTLDFLTGETRIVYHYFLATAK